MSFIHFQYKVGGHQYYANYADSINSILIKTIFSFFLSFKSFSFNLGLAAQTWTVEWFGRSNTVFTLSQNLQLCSSFRKGCENKPFFNLY